MLYQTYNVKNRTFTLDPGTQEFHSKNTSINSVKLPAIYKKIHWRMLKNAGINFNNCFSVLDIGAGKYTDHIREFLGKFNIKYYPYDPFNLPEKVNKQSLSIVPTAVICSNVLNVIKEEEIVKNIHNFIKFKDCPYFISVYEGDKSGIGRQTKKGCYQRNEKIINYIDGMETVMFGVLTNPEYTSYITPSGGYSILVDGWDFPKATFEEKTCSERCDIEYR